MTYISKLASAIYNDIVGGLSGYHENSSLSIEQLEDEIIQTRLQIIKEYSLKGLVPKKDLLTSINCVEVDCKDLDRCTCNVKYTGRPVAHIEIPQIAFDYTNKAIDYIGSTDRQLPFLIYTSPHAWEYYQKFRKRNKNKPYVYVDPAPNENGMLDAFIFNAPLLKRVSVVAIFKDPRQLERYECCNSIPEDNFSFIDTEVQKRLTEQKIRYYRQLANVKPNTQEYTTG